MTNAHPLLNMSLSPFEVPSEATSGSSRVCVPSECVQPILEADAHQLEDNWLPTHRPEPRQGHRTLLKSLNLKRNYENLSVNNERDQTPLRGQLKTITET